MAKDINAIISSMGYGYELKVTVNGSDIGLQGGKSESTRLFNPENSMAKEAPPEFVKKLFILKEGPNSISVEFKKVGAATDSLNFSLILDGFPAPHFFLYTDAAAQGKFEKTFTIENAFGENFKPVFICNEDEKKSAFLYVESSDCTVTPTLNGTNGMTLGMPGIVPLTGVKTGENKLTVTYDADPAATPEIKFAVATPSWTKFITKEIKDTSKKTEEFTFTAE